MGEKNKKIELTSIQIEEAIILYKELKTMKPVAKKFGVSNSFMWKTLKQSGINTKRDTYTVEENYFEKIDTRDKAYILGLLFSDGTLNSKYPQIKLKLTDLDLVQQVKTKLNYGGKLHEHVPENPKHKKNLALIITNTKMHKDLQKLGMKFRKTFDCQYPTCLNGFDSDFLRGFFDGDGSISTGFSGGKNWAEIKIVTTEDFVRGAIGVLTKVGIFSYEDYDRRIEKSKGIRDLRIRRLKDVLKFRDFIYKDLEGQLYLERKFEHFKEVKIRREVMCL